MAAKRCPKCDAAAGKTARFCKECGCNLEGDETEFVAFGDEAIDVLESDSAGTRAAEPSAEKHTDEGKPATTAPDSPVADDTPKDERGLDVSDAEMEEGPTSPPATPGDGAAHISSRYTLTILNGSSSGTSVTLKPGDTVVIGSGPESGLQLTGDGYVSRRHASFTFEGGQLRVRDEESSNGTYVFVDPARPLEHGQVVLAGETQIEVQQGS